MRQHSLERALMMATKRFLPHWQNLLIHESSPGSRGVSKRLAREARHYMASQFFPDQEPGSRVDGFRSENLEAMTFPDETTGINIGDHRSLVTIDWGFDIFQDIFEATGLYTHVLFTDDLSHGIRADFIEVLITVKPRAPDEITWIP